MALCMMAPLARGDSADIARKSEYVANDTRRACRDGPRSRRDDVVGAIGMEGLR